MDPKLAHYLAIMFLSYIVFIVLAVVSRLLAPDVPPWRLILIQLATIIACWLLDKIQ
jgi:phosphoglycerol transferase MdoB-like AlkP superfamily enzyme